MASNAESEEARAETQMKKRGGDKEKLVLKETQDLCVIQY